MTCPRLYADLLISSQPFFSILVGPAVCLSVIDIVLQISHCSPGARLEQTWGSHITTYRTSSIKKLRVKWQQDYNAKKEEVPYRKCMMIGQIT